MLNASIKARIVEVRFASSGKVSKVNKFSGENVNKGELLAVLDRSTHQAYLDRQLADYEKVRADFEIFSTAHPNPIAAIDNFLKTQKQASLNSSVKEVEVAKLVLDQCDLFSPVNGTILEDSAIVPGIYITPANASYKIIDNDSFYAEAEIEEKDIKKFSEIVEVIVTIESLGFSQKYQDTKVYSDGKKFFIKVPVPNSKGLLLGTSAILEV